MFSVFHIQRIEPLWLCYLPLVSVFVSEVRSIVTPKYSHIDDGYGVTWMFFPDGNGVPRVANLSTDENVVGRGGDFTDLQHRIFFELYTRQHQRTPKSVRSKREDLLEFNAYFLPKVETKIILHGWQSNSRSDTVLKIKDAYLRSRECNVIAVNWESAASSAFYFRSAMQTRDVGRYTAELIDYLHYNRGVNMDSIHLIGHSLGAHAAGYAGSYTSSRIQVARISGLDPALPGFELVSGPEQRLDPTDARFVDVIHTCGRTLGFYEPVGHVDFYPNGGTAIQPGCNGFLEVIESCSHGRAHHLFAESIESTVGFYGHQCGSWSSVNALECAAEATVLMGDPVSTSTRGIYFLRTAEYSPFALGLV